MIAIGAMPGGLYPMAMVFGGKAHKLKGIRNPLFRAT